MKYELKATNTAIKHSELVRVFGSLKKKKMCSKKTQKKIHSKKKTSEVLKLTMWYVPLFDCFIAFIMMFVMYLFLKPWLKM
jgi:nitrate/nitrite transporter NarK